MRYGACGILGGADGTPHRYPLHSNGSPPRPIKTKEVGIEIHPGDVLILESGGGGGWGDPALRNPDATARDIENGFVTRAPHPPAARFSPPDQVRGRLSLSPQCGERELGEQV